MSSICYVIIVSIVYIILVAGYIFCVFGKKENKELNKINSIFSIVIMMVEILSLIICIFLVNKQNIKEYLVVYIILFIFYMLIVNLYKTNTNIEKYGVMVIIKFFALCLVEGGLFAITFKVQSIIPIEDLVLNRVVVLIFICSLSYFLKSIISLKDDYKDFTNLSFNIIVSLYLCIYTVINLVLVDSVDSKDDIWKILACVSIITILFDKADKIVEFFNYDIKTISN